MIYLAAMIDGLLLGGLFAGLAVGLSLVFGIANILNLAHGAFVVLGAYIVFAVQVHLGINVLWALPVSMIAVFAIAWVVYRYAGLSRLVSVPLLMIVVFTFGLDLILTDGLRLIFGPESRAVALPPFMERTLIFGDVIVPLTRVCGAAAGLLITLCVGWILRFTKIGMAIRATRQDAGMASVNGVDVNKVYAITFALGAATAGLAGGFVVMNGPIAPDANVQFLLTAFAVTIIAGFGRVDAVAIGALIYGVLVSVMQTSFGDGIGSAAALSVLFFILLLRPYGLFGSQFY